MINYYNYLTDTNKLKEIDYVWIKLLNIKLNEARWLLIFSKCKKVKVDGNLISWYLMKLVINLFHRKTV